MGNIINLRQARKQKDRADKRKTSAACTAATGIKKAERTRVSKLKDLADRALDGHEREDKP